jgi:hypothetical protein
MNPMTIPGLQAGAGLLQLAGGLLMKKPKRPTYRIPGAINESVATARGLANSSLRPGNDQALANIRQSTSNAIGAAQGVSNNAAQILSAVAGANNREQKAIQGNNALNAQFSFNAKQGLMNQLNNLAGYQDKAFQLNQMEPYMQKAQTKAALIGSGLQNLWKSADSANFVNAFGGGGRSTQAGLGSAMGF